MKLFLQIFFMSFVFTGVCGNAKIIKATTLPESNLNSAMSTENPVTENPFSHHLGHYEILNAEQCIQNDYPAYCPWEKVEVSTNNLITCLKFTVESSLQHYCFESKRTEDETSEYSQTLPATWTSRKKAPSGEHWVYQVVFERLNNNPILKIEEYSWSNSTADSLVRIDKKIHLRLKELNDND